MLAAIQRLASVAESAVEADVVYAALASELLVALRADQVHVHVTSDAAPYGVAYVPGRRPQHYPLSRGAIPNGVEWCAATGMPLIVPWLHAASTLPGELTATWRVASALLVPVPGVAGSGVRAVALASFVTDRPIAEDEARIAQTFGAQAAAALAAVEARADASVDRLTGCLNHGAMITRLGEEVSRARRDGTPLAALLIDLDDFKSVNDVHGHPAGDRVLREVGVTLLQEVRSCDSVARYGGDEFLVILPATGGPRAEIAARRSLTRIRAIQVLPDVDARHVSASVGVTSIDHPTSADELLASADGALRRSKQTGKNRLEFATR